MLIVGAGPIGIMAAAVCRHVGARYIVITDINQYRLDLAKQFGITEAVNVRECMILKQTVEKLNDAMHSIGMKEGFDVGLEMSGDAQAISAMVNTMNTGGRMALLGLSGSLMDSLTAITSVGGGLGLAIVLLIIVVVGFFVVKFIFKSMKMIGILILIGLGIIAFLFVGSAIV